MQFSKTASDRPARSVRDYVRIALSGFAMGVCEVIPGVSGGTMAFILSIYEELINSVRDISQPEFVQAALRLRIGKLLALLNWRFLVALALGMFAAIFSMAGLIGWTLANYPALLWSFFFGLVLASILLVSRRIARWTPLLIGIFIVITVAAYWFVGLVPAETPNSWWFLILSGAIAICAMILPGISGSFVLVLLGKYDYVLAAASLSSLNVVTLVLVGTGAVLGLLSFARVVGWAFEHYHDIVVAALTGLMLGSLRVIWPWKQSLDFIDAHTAPANILPALSVNSSFNWQIVFAVICALVGIVAIVLIERLGDRQTATA